MATTPKDNSMIPFSKPPTSKRSKAYVDEVLFSRRLSGDNKFTDKCSKWLTNWTDGRKVLLTSSCTHSLEMTALLIGINPGDEVIMPSFTFSSTANAFLLRGAQIRFVDIRPDTMNIDERLIEQAITQRTRAIVVIHYGGVACEMDAILQIAQSHNLTVVEDAAHGLMSTYYGKALGSLGDFGCFSFHETKNYTSGEGGAIVLNNEASFKKAEIIREKGTNRSLFFKGEVEKYTWLDVGSSYLMSDLNAALLFGQLEIADEINLDRLLSWDCYYESLQDLSAAGDLELPTIPEGCKHNAHIFYVKVRDISVRTQLICFMREAEIYSTFHYVPLHSSPAGRKHGRFSGNDRYTTIESERIIRLPLYYAMTHEDRVKVCASINDFFARN